MKRMFDEFAAEINSGLTAHDPSDADAFIEHLIPAVEYAISSKLYVNAMNDVVRGVAERDRVANINITNGAFIFFSANSHSNWSFIFHKRKLDYLYLSPLSVVQAQIQGPALQLSQYKCVGLDSLDTFNPEASLELVDAKLASKGELFSRKARSEILDWHSATPDAEPGVTIRVNSVTPSSFEWYFDRATFLPRGMIPINVVDSNVTTLLSLLQVAGNQDSIDCVQPLLSSPAHYVRWAAAQTIAAINAEQGVLTIRELVNDPHEEVRTAARGHLANYI